MGGFVLRGAGFSPLYPYSVVHNVCLNVQFNQIGDAQILLSHKLREESLDISEKKTVSLSPREQLKNHVTDPAHPDSAWTCSFLMTHFSKPPLTKKRQKVFCSTGIDTNSAAVSRTSMSSTTSLDVCETDSDCPGKLVECLTCFFALLFLM